MYIADISNDRGIKGFTLVELIVSIVVIGILASITVVSYPGIRKQVTISQMSSDLMMAATKLSGDFSKYGKYPNTKEESGEGSGLIASDGTAFSYTYNSSINTYCLVASNGTLIYHIDAKTKSVSIGGCDTIAAFARALGGSEYEGTYDSTITSDGGYVITGGTDSQGAGFNDAFLAKYDSNDNLTWNRTWGGIQDDVSSAVIQTSDGGYVISGGTYSYGIGDKDAFLAKYDSSGNLAWSRTWGGITEETSYDVVQSTDGGYLITGITNSYDVGNDDAFLVKYDSAGTLLWSRVWGGTNYDSSSAVIQTNDGGYVIAGNTNSYGAGTNDGFLVKYSSSGTLMWNKTLGGVNYDGVYDIAETNDGGYILAGETYSYGAGNSDALLIKCDMSGNISWSKTWGGTGNESALALSYSIDGGYALSGSTDSYGVGGTDAFLSRYDSAGSLLWSRVFGGINDEYTYSVSQSSSGGYVVTGETSSYGAGNSDFLILKYSYDGSINNCSSPMCQNIIPTTFSPTQITNMPSAITSSPAVTPTSPAPTSLPRTFTSTSITTP